MLHTPKTSRLTLLAVLALFTAGNADAQGKYKSISNKEPRHPFPPAISLDSLASPEGFALNGSDHYDEVGWCVRAAGDVNADGIEDLIICAPGGADECQTIELEGRIRGASLTDLNGDSFPDLAYVEDESNTLHINLNIGPGSLTPTYSYPIPANGVNAVIAADLDLVSGPDLITSNGSSNTITVFFNNGDGSFTPGSSYAVGQLPAALASADFDNDGWIDIACSNVGSDDIYVYLNDGTGSLTSPSTIATGDRPISLKAARLDPDDYPDLVASCNTDDSVAVFRGLGDGSFSTPAFYATPDGPDGLALADIDGDTDVDIAVATANSSPPTFSLFRNNGFGTFAASINHQSAPQSRDVAIANFNNSGLPEIAVISSGANDSLCIFEGGSLALQSTNDMPAIPTSSFQATIPERILVGDVSGDGSLDVIAIDPSTKGYHYFKNDGQGGFPSKADSGQVYILFGSPGLRQSSSIDLTDLNGSNGFVINGLGTRDRLGNSAAGIGDFNGDGIDDFALGAPFADPLSREDAGEAYVIFGSPSLGQSGEVSLESLDGLVGFAIPGLKGTAINNRGDQCGAAVAGPGDMNGDGFCDLAIGCRYAYSQVCTGAPFAGNAYIILGGSGVGSSGSLDLTSIDGINGGRFYADLFNFEIGSSFGQPGDANCDGFPDLLVGAGPQYGDRVYCVYGGTAPWAATGLDLDELDGVNGFFMDINWCAWGGHDMDTAGDFNGDGAVDFIIGEPRYSIAQLYSRCALVFGNPLLGSAGPLSLDLLDGSDGFTLASYRSAQYAGVGVAGGGDINSDGFDDVLVGIPRDLDRFNPTNFRAGGAVVVFGGPNVGESGIFDLRDPDGMTGFELLGSKIGDIAGRSAAFADLDGDGISDLVIGAPGNVLSPMQNGSVYVLFGR